MLNVGWVVVTPLLAGQYESENVTSSLFIDFC
jgi:hypothetical protein